MSDFSEIWDVDTMMHCKIREIIKKLKIETFPCKNAFGAKHVKMSKKSQNFDLSKIWDINTLMQDKFIELIGFFKLSFFKIKMSVSALRNPNLQTKKLN